MYSSSFILYLLYIEVICCWTLIHSSCCVLNKMIWQLLAFFAEVISRYQAANAVLKKQQSKIFDLGGNSGQQFHMFWQGSREGRAEKECSCEMNILWDWQSVNESRDISRFFCFVLNPSFFLLVEIAPSLIYYFILFPLSMNYSVSSFFLLSDIFIVQIFSHVQPDCTRVANCLKEKMSSCHFNRRRECYFLLCYEKLQLCIPTH